MIQFDKSKSLQELEGKDWGEPNFNSHLVTECHRLHRVPLKDFTTEDLRIMISESSSFDYLLPLALETLEENPLAEGSFYPGDLLVSVLRVASTFWPQHPDLRSKTHQVAKQALAQTASMNRDDLESFNDAYKLFLRSSASPR